MKVTLLRPDEAPIVTLIKRERRRRWLHPIRTLRRLFRKKQKPLWLDKVLLPREFTLAKGASSYQEILEIKEGTENLRSGDAFFAPPLSGERRRPKIMCVHDVADSTQVRVRYMPQRRTRMQVGTTLILIGSKYLPEN